MKDFIYKNKLNTAIFLFFILFSLIHNIQPSLLYNKDGSFREFGVGFKHKTVIPIWLVSIILGLLSYISVLSYLAYT
jgi:hypothetical protein